MDGGADDFLFGFGVDHDIGMIKVLPLINQETILLIIPHNRNSNGINNILITKI